jgi:methyl-accepting chemotaxis protein
MTLHHIHLVRESWRRFAPPAPEATIAFYHRLFQINPECQGLFGTIDLAHQGCKLMRMLDEIVRLPDQPEALIREVARLGTRHAAYGVRDSDYGSVVPAICTHHAASGWAGDRGISGGGRQRVTEASATAATCRVAAGALA